MSKFFFSFLLVAAINTFAQVNTQPRTCGTPILPQQFENWVQSLNTNTNPGKTGGANVQSVFNIPVIVHIIHNNEAVNSISATSGNNLNAAQVIDQINILNKDFNGLNSDTTLIPSTFKPVLGKCQINFCLAVVNPTGGILAEPGIDRINRATKGWSSPPYSSTYVTTTIKPNSIWDPTKYLNIWVSPLSSGLLGFATFPNPGTSGLSGLTSSFGNSTTDGVVILNSSFGSIGTAQFGAYNKGRTATHEVGHWVGLRHIWGDSNCGTDYCNDTPAAQTANYNCPTFPYKLGTCTNNTTGEMTMNFMDYTNDACMYMFTNDQKNRAQLILTNSAMRAALVTSTVCNLPTLTNDIGISYVSMPTYSLVANCINSLSPVVNVTNFGSSIITSALFTYDVDGVNTQTMSWTGSAAPNTSFTVALSPIFNLSVGLHVFNADVSAPNGLSDNNIINNTNSQQFSITGILNVSAPSVSTCIGSPTILNASGATSYSWSNGAVSSSITVNNTLTTVYSFTAVTGACSVQKTVTVSIQNSPTLTLTASHLSCSSCNNASASVIVAGGTAPYSYSWTPINLNSPVLNDLGAGCYTVTVTDSNGCKSTDSTCVSFDTGIFDQKNATIFVNVIPNPSTGLFVVDLNFLGLKHIEVIDLRGLLIVKQKTELNFVTIDLSNYPKAVYFLKIVSENKTFTAKIIKE